MFLEKVSSDSRNLMALALINNILSKNKKKQQQQNQKHQGYLNEAMA